MADQETAVRCPRCGHEWTQDLGEVRSKKLNYRERGQTTQYRITCPECGGHWLMTMAEEGPRKTETTANQEEEE
jgi:DNA-directed RNA polymerase subunit RPC12/RpoP